MSVVSCLCDQAIASVIDTFDVDFLTMQGALRAAISYIEASALAGTQAPMITTITEGRVHNLKSMLGRTPTDLLDMTASISLLGSTSVFTAEQRSSLVQAIHAKMSSDDVGAKNVDTKAQSHPFIENYLTNSLWDQLFDKSLSEYDRVRNVVNFLHNRNGCKYPDTSSRRRFVAIILLASEQKMTPQSAKACFDLFAAVNVKMRAIRAHVPSTCRSFPLDVQDFMALYPDMYDVDDPPIPSRFSRSSIDAAWTSVPARHTNKLLMEASNTRMASLPTGPKVDDQMRSMIENPMVINMMRAFANMANAREPTGRPPAPFNIEYRSDAPLFRNEHQALANGACLQHTKEPPQEPQGGAAARPPTRQPTSSTIDDEIDNMISKGILAPPKVKAPTVKKPADGAETDDTHDEGDDDAAKDDADRAETLGGSKKNKKRAGGTLPVDNRAAKRQSCDKGSVDNRRTTKDYGTNLKAPPKLSNLVLPCFYNNCKVYGTDMKFRVYPRPNVSKYDKGFPFTKDTKAKVWLNVVEYCKKPVIPKTSANFIK